MPCRKCKILVLVLKNFHQRHLDAPMCPSLNRRLLSGWLIHSAVSISLINVSELYLATELSQIKIMEVMFHSCLNLMNYYSISYIMPFFLSYCRHISLEQLLQSPSGMMMVWSYVLLLYHFRFCSNILKKLFIRFVETSWLRETICEIYFRFNIIVSQYVKWNFKSKTLGINSAKALRSYLYLAKQFPKLFRK